MYKEPTGARPTADASLAEDVAMQHDEDQDGRAPGPVARQPAPPDRRVSAQPSEFPATDCYGVHSV